MSAGVVLGEGEADPLGLTGRLCRVNEGGDLLRGERRYLARLYRGDHLAHRIRRDGAAMRAARRGHGFAPKCRRRRSATVSASLASPGSSEGTAA